MAVDFVVFAVCRRFKLSKSMESASQQGQEEAGYGRLLQPQLPKHGYDEDALPHLRQPAFCLPSRPSKCLLLLCILLLQLALFFACFSWLWRSTPLHLPPSPPPSVQLSLPNLNSSRPLGHTHPALCPLGRVFVYDLPPQFNAHLLAHCSSLVPWADLCPALDNNGIGLALDLPSWLGTGFWYSTSQFSGEVLYHARMLLHPCRTLDPDRASAFFVPFYAGLDVGRYLFVKSSPDERDRLSHQLLAWLQEQHPWKRNGGRDHFIMIGRITWDFRREESSLWDRIWGRSGWGNDLFLRPELRNPFRLTIEKNLADKQEIAVPYPTSFHPRTDADLGTWQAIVRSMKRNLLFSYAGGPRPQFQNDFRQILLDQCARSARCRSFDCSKQRCEHPLPVTELFLDSVFCLQPRGDSLTRRSMFDSMIAGCIPVFFWRRTAYLQYGWHLPADGDSYSVFISRNDVRKGKGIEDFLRGFSEKRINKLRENLIAAMPGYIYGVPVDSSLSFRDAFDIAVDGVLNLTRSELQR